MPHDNVSVPHALYEELNPARGDPYSVGMHRISGWIIRPVLISVIRPDTGFDLPDIRTDTETSRISGRISGQIVEITYHVNS
jgi:hypothetical protein